MRGREHELLFVSMPPRVDASACVHVGHSAAQRDENSQQHIEVGMEGCRLSEREREKIISCYVIPAKT